MLGNPVHLGRLRFVQLPFGGSKLKRVHWHPSTVGYLKGKTPQASQKISAEDPSCDFAQRSDFHGSRLLLACGLKHPPCNSPSCFIRKSLGCSMLNRDCWHQLCLGRHCSASQVHFQGADVRIKIVSETERRQDFR